MQLGISRTSDMMELTVSGMGPRFLGIPSMLLSAVCRQTPPFLDRKHRGFRVASVRARSDHPERSELNGAPIIVRLEGPVEPSLLTASAIWSTFKRLYPCRGQSHQVWYKDDLCGAVGQNSTSLPFWQPSHLCSSRGDR